MTRVLFVAVAALILTVAGLSAYIIKDGGGAEAHAPIDCNVAVNTTPDPDEGTAVCNGLIHVQTPFGAQHISFDLTVLFLDNDSSGGPSRGDTVTSCHLEVGPPVNFSGDIHRGPCP